MAHEVESDDRFARVSEGPGSKATKEQLQMLLTRYELASSFSSGKSVLEVGCGPGLGLGLLASNAAFVMGGDIAPKLLEQAHGHYGARVQFARLDAQRLPFKNDTFDLVVLFEALYYLLKPQTFTAEASRILRPGGVLVICSANPERSDFIRSPHSHRYLNANELRELLESHGMEAEILGGFPTGSQSLRDKGVRLARKFLLKLNLVPGSLSARERLKRLAYGRLETIGPELRPDGGNAQPLVPLSKEQDVTGFKVIYAVGQLPS